MKIKLHWHDRTFAHIRLTVFMGPDVDHFASTGMLTFRHDEALAFRSTLRRGNHAVSGIFEDGWIEREDDS